MNKSKDFNPVTCPQCSNVRVCYKYSKTKVDCEVCFYRLVTPQGGKAKLHGLVTKS